MTVPDPAARTPTPSKTGDCDRVDDELLCEHPALSRQSNASTVPVSLKLPILSVLLPFVPKALAVIVPDRFRMDVCERSWAVEARRVITRAGTRAGATGGVIDAAAPRRWGELLGEGGSVLPLLRTGMKLGSGESGPWPWPAICCERCA
jgi:hypothetical protein